jgi:hypothetical protein
MSTENRTPVRRLIENLQGAKSVEELEKVFYDILEIERYVIANAYESAMANISNGVTMDGLEYYDSTFDNR